MGDAAVSSLQERVAFLSQPRSYPHHPRSVRSIETHFAWVFLAGPFAFKLKKPTRQASMDNRSLASRRAACLNELRLNRRLADDVYLRVLPLRRAARGGLSLSAGAGAVDWLIKMRRLSSARMLDRLIADRTLRPRHIERVVARLSAFFETARPQPLRPRAYLEWLRARAGQTVRELSAARLGLARLGLRQLYRAQLDFIARQRYPLGLRGAQVLEGHGDLRPEHIFIGTHECQVIDCLEFDAGLRRLDPAAEIAFLMLECERLGGRAVAQQLLTCYRRERGDSVSDGIVHFYISQHAMTRAMLAAWHLKDPEFRGQRRLWRARARGYLLIANRHMSIAQRVTQDSAA